MNPVAGKPRPEDPRTRILAAAAEVFAEKGFDGVGVDDIARQAGVNKAMIYYHFADKLALYREVVAEMMGAVGARVTAVAEAAGAPPDKLDAFIAAFVEMADQRPWFPTMLLREIAEGAPHLDVDTLGRLRVIIAAFGRILAEGQATGAFRPVHPVLAYVSVVGPLMFNAARERVASQPGREHIPMLVDIPHSDLLSHMQLAARRMLEPR